jgi:Lipase (class 3)
MRLSRVVLRCAVPALLALGLGACAHRPDEVAVGIGTAAYRTEPAAGYAALYRPYAQMAALAYTDQENLFAQSANRAPLCPDKARLRGAPGGGEAARWVNQLEGEKWSCLFGRIGYDSCPPGQRCVTGLQYQVWRRTDCREAVIAFRGTDSGDIGDWISNLRWFVLAPYFDEYDQVGAEIRDVINKIYASGCRHPRIIVTGHSLGGGLAQHAAYGDKRITYVYAFDPSPVTGYFDFPWRTLRVTRNAFGTDRIYEAGEILSLPRYLASGLFPTSSCLPRVRIVRFATISAPSLLERHRIQAMTEGLIALSKLPHPGPLPTGFKGAQTCDLATP